MTTREQIIAAAKSAGVIYNPERNCAQLDKERFYAIAFEAGAASRNAEIAELVAALEHARPFLHGNTHSGYAAILVDKALAKVRKS